MEIVGTQVVKNEDIQIIPENVKIKSELQSRCKMCQYEYKEEVENHYLSIKNRNGALSKSWEFAKNRGLDVSYPAFRNHIYHHFLAKEEANSLEEWAENINKWIPIQNNKEDSLIRKMAVLEKQFSSLDSEIIGMSPEEKRKTSDTMVKLANTLLNYQTKLEEFKKGDEPLKIILKIIIEVFSSEMKKDSTDELKDSLRSISEDIIDKIKVQFPDFVG